MRGIAVRTSTVAFLAMAVASGCSSPAIIKSVRDLGFVPLHPPRTGVEAGSIVILDGAFNESPQLAGRPSDVNLTAVVSKRRTVDVVGNHETKYDLATELSVPRKLAIQLGLEGVASYSVVAKGNHIVEMPVFPYVTNVYSEMAQAWHETVAWQSALKAGRLRYLSDLFFTSELEYKFYDADGEEAEVSVEAVQLPNPPELKAKWSWTDKGTLTYKATTVDEAICVGFVFRAIRKVDDRSVALVGAAAPTFGDPLPPDAELDRPVVMEE